MRTSGYMGVTKGPIGTIGAFVAGGEDGRNTNKIHVCLHPGQLELN